MRSGHTTQQDAKLKALGPSAEKEADKYPDLTPGQRKAFVEMVKGYLASHNGAAAPNGYDQLAALARRSTK